MQKNFYQNILVLKEHYNKKFIITGIVFFLFFLLKSAIASNPIDMVILLDRSGSMHNTDSEGLSISAASFIVDQLSLADKNNRVAIVPFSSHVYILGQVKADPSRALSSNFAGMCEMLSAGISREPVFHFRELSPDNPQQYYNLLKRQLQIGGYTELGEALRLAGEILSNSNKNRRKMIFLISDGKPEPNINDPKRLTQLIGIVGSSLIKRIKRRGFQQDVERLNELYADYILKNIIPSLADKGIEIYPVAFHKRGMEPQALVDYLKRIKKMTTGDENLIVADSQDLIPKLVGFIPSGANHVQIGYFPNVIENSPSRKTIEIKIPKIALKSRFFLFYKNARRTQKLRIQVYREGKLVADSSFPERSPEVVVTQSRKRDGGLVFQSIKIESSEKAHGNFRIRLLDESVGRIEGIPNADLLVDIRCKFIPSVDIEPQPIRARSPFEIRIKLLARLEGQDIVLPIRTAHVFFVGRRPDSISGYMKKIINVSYRKGVAILRSNEGLEYPGRYEMRVKLLFQPPDSDRIFPTYFSIPVKVTSALPLQGNVWLTLRGIRGNKQNISVVLPSLGEKSKVIYRELEVRTSLPRMIDGLRLVMPPLQHPETGTILGSLTSNWAHIEPKVINGLCNSHPVPVKVTVSIPPNFPSNLPDGLYRSTIELRDGVELIYSVPVSIGLSIPRFVTSKGQIKQRFNPEEPFMPVVKKLILCPGQYERRMKIKLWSTSLSGVSAKLMFEDPHGITTTQDGEEIRVEKLLFTAPNKRFNIPGKNSRSARTVFATIKLKDPSLNGKDIYNIGYITAPYHRELPVKFVVQIRFISPWILRIIYSLIAIIGLCLIYSSISKLKCKHLFKGKTNTWTPKGDNEGYELRLGKKRLGTFIYENANFYFDPSGKKVRYQPTGSEDQIDIYNKTEIHEGDELVIATGKKRFVIGISKVDLTPGFPSLSFNIVRSPLGNGISAYFYLLSGSLLSLASIVNIINPYLVMKILRL